MNKLKYVTTEFLRKKKACDDGIEWFVKNKLENFPINQLAEIRGDYKGYIKWMYDELDGYTYDQFGNKLSYENSTGYWEKYTYDQFGNKLSYETSSSYWEEYTYDQFGNKLTYKNSKGYWDKYTYDQFGNKLIYTNSTGCWETYEYYPNGQLKKLNDLELPLMRVV